jgi:uncharacterized delta-60 repeat protein
MSSGNELATVKPRQWRIGASLSIERHNGERIWIELLEARVLLAGQIDLTFGDNGIARGLRVDGNDKSIVALLPQADGSIIAEATNNGYASERYIARIGPDGQVDRSLGENGLVLLKQKPAYILDAIFYGAVIMDRQGRFVLPTGNTTFGGTVTSSLIVSRYNADGSPDPLWAGSGEVEVALPATGWVYTDARGAVADAGGRITVGVSCNDASMYLSYYLVRFNPDGSLDESFGDGGILPITPPHGTAFQGRLIGDDQGRLIITGSIVRPDTSAEATILRLMPDGTPDPTFANGGWFSSYFGRTYSSFRATELDSKGRIVIRFIRQRPNDPELWYVEHGVLRLTTDGALDTTFGLGSGEYVFRSWDEPLTTADYSFKLGIQPDDKILTTFQARGHDEIWYGDNYILRLSENGTRDLSFGDGGVVLGLPGFGRTAWAPNDIAFANDRLLLAGSTVDSFVEDTYTRNGSWSITALVANDVPPQQPEIPPTDNGNEDDDDDQQPPVPPTDDPRSNLMPLPPNSSRTFPSRFDPYATTHALNIVDSKFTNDDLLAPASDDVI